MIFVWNAAQYVDIAAQAAAAFGDFHISDIIECLDHDQSNSISKLIIANREIPKRYSNILTEKYAILI